VCSIAFLGLTLVGCDSAIDSGRQAAEEAWAHQRALVHAYNRSRTLPICGYTINIFYDQESGLPLHTIQTSGEGCRPREYYWAYNGRIAELIYTEGIPSWSEYESLRSVLENIPDLIDVLLQSELDKAS